MKIKETRYQAQDLDIPKFQTLETALIEQREPLTVKGMIHQINRQRKEVFIVGDLKNLQERKISRSAKVKVSSFPGCTTIDMRDHIKPTLRKNPDAIVIHVGTNSLRSSASVRDCAEEIANLATMIGNESSPVLR